MRLDFSVCFRAYSAKQAVRDGNADEEQVEKLPELGEPGLGDGFRGLGREESKKKKKDGNQEKPGKKGRERLTWLGMNFGFWF